MKGKRKIMIELIYMKKKVKNKKLRKKYFFQISYVVVKSTKI